MGTIPNSTLKDRLWRKSALMPNGCIEFQGYICKSTGYGKISNRPGVPIGAHVAAWAVKNGEIPESLVVRHKCDNRRCVNVNHLELGTQKDNVQDMHDRGRFDNYKHRVTLCPEGHEYDSIDVEGYRSCQVCRLKQARRSSLKRRIKQGKAIKGTYCKNCWFLEENCHCGAIEKKVRYYPRYEYKKEVEFV